MLGIALNIDPVDTVIVVLYLAGILVLGCWAGIRQRKGAEGKAYFLAGGTLRWPIIGLALFSTNISTIHLVSQAEEGYKNGLAYGNYEWMAPFTLIALALFFAPFYVRSKVATLPDFLEKRYNRACRNWLAFLSIISAIFIHIGFSLYTGAVVLKGMFGININTSIVVISVLTGIYTILGGLMAVVVTESIQTVILLIGAVCITGFGLWSVGGVSGVSESVEPVKLNLLRTAEDPANLPWYSVFLGYPIIGLWYWCADQTIVQRVLAAKDENHARIGPLFAGFIKILPVFIFVLPGTICLALANRAAIPHPPNSTDTYGHLIRHILPMGLKGIVAAALLAALMGTVSGALNSIATLFSYDIYKQFKPETSDRKLVFIGRTVTFSGMVLAILWSPLISHFESIYQGVNTLISYIAPPITAVFLLGVFWKRASGRGAEIALYSGTLLGFVVFLLDWFKESTGWPVHFMMAAFYLCIVCGFIQVVISLYYPHTHTPESERLVWSNWLDALRGPAWRGIGNYKVLSVVLFVVMVGLYVAFGHTRPRPPESPVELKPGLNYAVFKGKWESPYQFRNSLNPARKKGSIVPKPVKAGTTSTFHLPSEAREGPSALKFEGYIEIKETGNYTFWVNAEGKEGEWKTQKPKRNTNNRPGRTDIKKPSPNISLYIGEIMLRMISAEGPEQKARHNPDSGAGTVWRLKSRNKVALKAGKHKLTLIYLNNGILKLENLSVAYQGPKAKKAEISNELLFSSSKE